MLITQLQQKHPFHLVNASPWPIFASLGAFSLVFCFVIFLHGYESAGNFGFIVGLLALIYSLLIWWRDVLREATFAGNHTFAVQNGLRLGMVLFIVSEVMFFLSFFLGFFPFKFISIC